MQLSQQVQPCGGALPHRTCVLPCSYRFHLWALNSRVLSNKESYSVLEMGSDVALGAAHYSYAKLSWAEEIQAEHIGCELTERAHLFMHRHTAAVCHPPHTLSKSKCKLPRIMNEPSTQTTAQGSKIYYRLHGKTGTSTGEKVKTDERNPTQQQYPAHSAPYLPWNLRTSFTYLKWSCSETLKSKASPRSVKPMPMNALRPVKRSNFRIRVPYGDFCRSYHMNC